MALPGGSHCSPASIFPLPHTGPCVVEVEVDVEVVVVLVRVVLVDGSEVVVVVVLPSHEQQLLREDTVPPSETQPRAECSISQRVPVWQSRNELHDLDGISMHRPVRMLQVPNVGMSHTTEPSKPQRDLAAQLTMLPWQPFGMSPRFSSLEMTCATHATYLPWLL